MQMKQAVERVQASWLKPLNESEAQTLVTLLAKVVSGHEQDAA
jgi:hypothetical protein